MSFAEGQVLTSSGLEYHEGDASYIWLPAVVARSLKQWQAQEHLPSHAPRGAMCPAAPPQACW